MSEQVIETQEGPAPVLLNKHFKVVTWTGGSYDDVRHFNNMKVL